MTTTGGLAIADLADQGEQARAAAVRLEKSADNTTAGARLLIAAKAILGEHDGDIGSQQLIDKLTANPDAEWAEWRGGKPIIQKQLANLLKPFKIFPEEFRTDGHKVRGYRRSQFEDAWARYL